MKIISATEFKAKCLKLMDDVQRSGEELVITKHSRPIARLIPEKPSKPWLALRGKGNFSGDPFAPTTYETEIEALKP